MPSQPILSYSQDAPCRSALHSSHRCQRLLQLHVSLHHSCSQSAGSLITRASPRHRAAQKTMGKACLLDLTPSGLHDKWLRLQFHYSCRQWPLDRCGRDTAASRQQMARRVNDASAGLLAVGHRVEVRQLRQAVLHCNHHGKAMESRWRKEGSCPYCNIAWATIQLGKMLQPALDSQGHHVVLRCCCRFSPRNVISKLTCCQHI